MAADVPVAILAGVAGVAFLASIAVLIVRSDDKRRKQRAEIAGRYAAERGWDFAAEDDSVLDEITVYPLKPVSSGPASCANVMRGQYLEHPMLVFDFIHTKPGSGMGAGSDTFHYHVVGLRLPAPTPTLSVLRETHRRHALTVDNPEFHRRYWVDPDTTDLGFAAAVLSPAMVDLTLREDAPTWAIDGGYLLLITPGQLPVNDLGYDLAADRVDPLLDLAARMVDALPPASGDGTGQ